MAYMAKAPRHHRRRDMEAKLARGKKLRRMADTIDCARHPLVTQFYPEISISSRSGIGEFFRSETSGDDRRSTGKTPAAGAVAQRSRERETYQKPDLQIRSRTTEIWFTRVDGRARVGRGWSSRREVHTRRGFWSATTSASVSKRTRRSAPELLYRSRRVKTCGVN